MKKENDIVDDIFTRIKDILGDEFQGQIVVKLDDVETKIRQDWGGTEPYIARKKDIQKRKSVALEKLKCGLSVSEAAKQSGVSETLIYTMLRRR